MIHPIVPLIAYMSRYFTLKAGDVVLTGTPAGVGPLLSGDELDIRLMAKRCLPAFCKICLPPSAAVKLASAGQTGYKVQL